MAAGQCEAHIAIEFDGDVVRGQLTADGAAPTPFVGWLELLTALQGLRPSPPLDDDPGRIS